MAFRSGLMEPYTKANGLKIKLKVKVHSGMPKETYTQVNSRLIKQMDSVYIHMLMALDMKANGSTMFSRAKEKKPGLTELNTLVSTKTE